MKRRIILILLLIFMAGYKVPKFVEICDSLPKSTVGKILRRELVRSDRGSNASPKNNGTDDCRHL